MKKIAFLLALSIFCGGVLCAQSPVKVGLKIGANYTNPSGVDFSDWSSDGTVRTGVGLTAGAFVKVNLPLTWLFVEAEALYSTYKQRVDPEGDGAVYKVKSEKVEFPVHVGDSPAQTESKCMPVLRSTYLSSTTRPQRCQLDGRPARCQGRRGCRCPGGDPKILDRCAVPVPLLG